MTKSLVIFGAGEIAEIAHFYFTKEGAYRVVAFTVDDEYRGGKETFHDLPLVSANEVARRYPPASHTAFVAVSYARMNAVREMKYRFMKEAGYTLASYVSPHCTNFARSIGDNCLILEDNTIQPFVKIGNNVTLWSGNHIGHHSTIGDHCFISSHVVVSGGVVIHNNCFIGVNSTLRDHIEVGAGALIGMGACITRNVKAKAVYKGVASLPAEISSDQIRSL